MTLKIEMDEENWIVLVSFHVQVFKTKITDLPYLLKNLRNTRLKLKLATDLI